MSWFKIFFPFALVSFLFLIVHPVFAEENTEDVNNQTDEAFKLLDTDKDGMICREEFDELDKDKDGTICKDEWERWEFKAENKSKGLTQKFDLNWYDNNGDGFMSQEDYHRYPPGIPGGRP
jgi:Ca2+-binding EF-hand superfamily protein